MRSLNDAEAVLLGEGDLPAPQKSPLPGRPSHIPALDGVRGIAILLVLVGHFTPEGQGSRLAGMLKPITNGMWIGVDLFFVLSGFLITGILLRAKSSPRYFRNFYGRRFLRIFPLYYLVISGVTICLLTLPSWQNLSALRHAWPWYWFFGTNYLAGSRGFRFLDYPQVSLFPLWSLAVEEHFYLFWPFVAWLCSEVRVAWVCAALMVIAPACRAWAIFHGAGYQYSYVATQCRMDALAVGALLAVLMQTYSASELLRRYGWIGIVCAIAAAGFIAMDGQSLGFGSIKFQFDRRATIVSYSALDIACAFVLLLALAGRGLAARVTSHASLRFFGIYSYGIYVYHGLILNRLMEIFPVRRLSIGGNPWTGLAPHYALCIAAVTAIAMLSYHLFEKHFLKLKRCFV